MEDISVLVSSSGGADVNGEKVTGIALMAQRFMVLLLSSSSEVNRDGEGGNLTDIAKYGAGGAGRESSVMNLINIAISDAVVAMRNSELPTDSADERLASAKLESLDFDAASGGVEMNIIVTSVSGSATQITETL